MDIRTALLAGSIVPGFFLVAQTAMAELLPPKDVMVAQAQTDQQRDRRQQRGGQRPANQPGAGAQQSPGGGQGREQRQQQQQQRVQDRQQQQQQRVQERQQQQQERQRQQQQRVQQRQQQQQERQQQQRQRVQERQQQQQQRVQERQQQAPSQQQPQTTQPTQQTRPGQVPGRGPGGQQRALERPQTPDRQPALQPGRPAATAVTPPPTSTPRNVRRLDDFRGQRRETQQGGRTVIQEPGRTIVRDGGRLVIHHNETDRFRANARNVRTERRGRDNVTIIERPNGVRIITVTDDNGRLVRRIRRDARGREYVLIDNTYRGAAIAAGATIVGGLVILNLAAPVIRIPPDRYIVDADRADRALIYDTLMAPPVDDLEREYTLDEIRYNAALRDRMRRVDIDTVTFDTGSWEVTPDQAQRLQVIADAILQAIDQNPAEMFQIEGYTDAVGDEVDNLSLSDRRAEAVAQVLSEQFNVPPENLTTQGYGEQFLKIPTDGPERRNRRVTVRRITPLLNGPVAQRRN